MPTNVITLPDVINQALGARVVPAAKRTGTPGRWVWWRRLRQDTGREGCSGYLEGDKERMVFFKHLLLLRGIFSLQINYFPLQSFSQSGDGLWSMTTPERNRTTPFEGSRGDKAMREWPGLFCYSYDLKYPLNTIFSKQEKFIMRRAF